MDNKYKRYRDRRNACITANLQERLGPGAQLPRSHRDFTALNRIKDLDEQAQVWAASLMMADNHDHQKGSTEPTPDPVTPISACCDNARMEGMHPRELPRKLKLAATLYTLRNLGNAYRVISQDGDEGEVTMLHRILGICQDMRDEEIQDAMNELTTVLRDHHGG